MHSDDTARSMGHTYFALFAGTFASCRSLRELQPLPTANDVVSVLRTTAGDVMRHGKVERNANLGLDPRLSPGGTYIRG